ncbi:MAG: helix-turn-helix domain-containing protein [Actinocatenispora sp.]
MASRLPSADATALSEACRQTRLPLDSRDHLGELAGDLLAVFCTEEAASPAAVRELHDAGAYAVLVQPEPSARGTLEALRLGYGFVLASPLRAERLTAFLTYLRDVSAPPGTQIVDLDQVGTLSTRTAHTALDEAEAAALRLFARGPSRIVSRRELAEATDGGDPLALVSALRTRFEQVGSGAKILKVPHMGFRLVGEVRIPATG